MTASIRSNFPNCDSGFPPSFAFIAAWMRLLDHQGHRRIIMEERLDAVDVRLALVIAKSSCRVEGRRALHFIFGAARCDPSCRRT